MTGTKAAQYNRRFMEFIEIFARLGEDTRLFPKKCRSCGKAYQSFPEYIHGTSAVQHCLEDYRDVSSGLGTMQYRNCSCGTTLTISFSQDDYPMLDRFWEMIGREAKKSSRPVQEVVSEFREQCNRYIVEQADPGQRG